MTMEKTTENRSYPRSYPSHAPVFPGAQKPLGMHPTELIGVHRPLARKTGVALFMVMMVTLFRLAHEVMLHGWLVAQDGSFAVWVYRERAVSLTAALRVVTDLHSTTGIVCLAGLFAAYLLRTRRLPWLKTLMLVLPTGMLINVLVKQGVHRLRPPVDSALVTVSSFSFPSGHTTGTALFYGVLAAFLLQQVSSKPARVGVVAAAALMVLLVAFSRIYLGVHYLSDVVGSLVLSVGWLGLCTGLGWFPSRNLVR
jgi:membrane-associated phospholipid phosphatase